MTLIVEETHPWRVAFMDAVVEYKPQTGYFDIQARNRRYCFMVAGPEDDILRILRAWKALPEKVATPGTIEYTGNTVYCRVPFTIVDVLEGRQNEKATELLVALRGEYDRITGQKMAA